MVTFIIINSYNIKKEKIMNTTLQKIVAKAKQLKKQAPSKFAKWTDYVKEASKHIKPVIKKAKKTAKKVIKKSIGYKKDRLNVLKKTTPLIKKYIKENKYSRKEAIKNSIIDAGFMSGSHTDKNSHNVKLAIYSGVNDNNINELKNALFMLELYQGELNDLLKNPNKEPFNKLPKKIYTSVIKSLKNNIQSKKRQIIEIKKLIK